MSNEAKGPYKCRVVGLCSGEVVDERTGAVVSESNHKDDAYAIAHMMNKAHTQALTSQAARVDELYDALQSVEWIMGHCPSCGGPQEQGHASDCYIASALTPKEAT